MGEVVHEKPENSAEVVLRSSHGDLYGNGRLRVTVATGKEDKYITASQPTVLNVAGLHTADLQSLYAGDDGVERSLDVGCGAGADHR